MEVRHIWVMGFVGEYGRAAGVGAEFDDFVDDGIAESGVGGRFGSAAQRLSFTASKNSVTSRAVRVYATLEGFSAAPAPSQTSRCGLPESE